MPALPRSSGTNEIRAADLIAIIRGRVRLIVCVVAAFLAAGSLYCVVRAPRYDAMSDLAIHPEGSDTLDIGDLSSATGGGGLDWSAKIETQVRILKSQSLAWTVISQLRLDREPGFAGRHEFLIFGKRVVPSAPDNIEDTSPKRRNALLAAFAKSLTVEAVPRTQAVEIKFRSTDPQLAAKVVNQLAGAYLERNFETRYEATVQASDWLAKQLNGLKEDVEASQQKLAAFQKRTGILGTDENDNLVLDKLDALSAQLTDAKADLIVKEAKYRLAQTGNPELIGTVVPDSVLPALRSQEADLKNQLAQANSIYGPRYPKVVQLRNQLAQVDRSLTREVHDIEERFHTDYEAADTVQNQLQAAFKQQEQEAYKLSGDLSQYGVLKREVDSGRDLYEDLLKKLKEAGVMAGLRSSNIDVIDKATLPTRPVDPNVPLVMLLSLVFGIGCGGCLAFLVDSLDNSIRTPDDLEAITSLPVFGMVPNFPINADPHGNRHHGIVRSGRDIADDHSPVTLLKPNSEASESFRSLRTAVLLSSPGAPPKRLLVTSAIPGDGKSTISVNIAVVLAQRGARVLLVDADLRRGALEKSLGLSRNFGLSGVLTSGGSWRDAVEPVHGVGSLSVLQCGLRPPNPADLLGSISMDDLLDQWAAEFDHMVIDSPPCLAVTDGVTLAPKMDAVLLVVRAGQTPRTGLRRALDLLASVDANVAGLVLNDFNLDEHYYGYGYGRSPYGRYYNDEETELQTTR